MTGRASERPDAPTPTAQATPARAGGAGTREARRPEPASPRPPYPRADGVGTGAPAPLRNAAFRRPEGHWSSPETLGRTPPPPAAAASSWSCYAAPGPARRSAALTGPARRRAPPAAATVAATASAPRLRESRTNSPGAATAAAAAAAAASALTSPCTLCARPGVAAARRARPRDRAGACELGRARGGEVSARGGRACGSGEPRWPGEGTLHEEGGAPQAEGGAPKTEGGGGGDLADRGEKFLTPRADRGKGPWGGRRLRSGGRSEGREILWAIQCR
ncbi:translation initiation factor IF-2-like [Myotis myotis]|uniref:translation initiation factor IF-2-like n=1 Tax=Myotis myotis TaxID=51298 RepID=UPI00174E1276|nr:translation initiation factor IF-2-like [Myotis myotis]